MTEHPALAVDKAIREAKKTRQFQVLLALDGPPCPRCFYWAPTLTRSDDPEDPGEIRLCQAEVISCDFSCFRPKD
jgi:hypothetical protein